MSYHLSRLGVHAIPITALGCDFLGDEAWRRIAAWGLDNGFIARRPRRPTGTVRATLDARGVAHYRIARNVAWDAIPFIRARRNPRAPSALVFGTLALRQEFNRRSLAAAFRAWPGTLRVLDLNLRPPFDRPVAVTFALQHAQMVKLNDDELARLTGLQVRSISQIKRATREFAARRTLSRVCLTAGSRGAGLWWDGNWIWENGRAVEVRDTIGAGDAFLGSFLASLLARHVSPAEALANACRLGEFVASRDGPTPHYVCTLGGRPRDAL